jgi:hypothetical protein
MRQFILVTLGLVLLTTQARASSCCDCPAISQGYFQCGGNLHECNECYGGLGSCEPAGPRNAKGQLLTAAGCPATGTKKTLTGKLTASFGTASSLGEAQALSIQQNNSGSTVATKPAFSTSGISAPSPKRATTATTAASAEAQGETSSPAGPLTTGSAVHSKPTGR